MGLSWQQPNETSGGTHPRWTSFRVPLNDLETTAKELITKARKADRDWDLRTFSGLNDWTKLL